MLENTKDVLIEQLYEITYSTVRNNGHTSSSQLSQDWDTVLHTPHEHSALGVAMQLKFVYTLYGILQ